MRSETLGFVYNHFGQEVAEIRDQLGTLLDIADDFELMDAVAELAEIMLQCDDVAKKFNEKVYI
jgi:hypothetical protein